MNNVLFIDDEPHILHSMKLAFRNENLNLFFAEKADIALDILRNNDISVIVSDNMMPGINGVDLLSKARQISPDSIRILLTGQCDEDCMMKSINIANVFKLILKPFTASAIVAIVKKCVRMYKENQLVGKLKQGNINLAQAIQRHSMNNMNFDCQWLTPSDLQIGMTLLSDLKNKRRILLMKKGRTLTIKDLELIKSLNIEHKIAVTQ
jgi:DNA-binding NtrC family response regulator